VRELCGYEMETLGFYLSAHPVELVRVPPDVIPACDMRKYENKRVRMVGHGIAAKLLGTRNSGKLMKMLTLEDTTDTFEAVLFPRVYDRFATRTLGTGPYLVEGKVDISLGSPTLNVEKVDVLM
jgi:DNA polymerase-3 subunit alpha